MGKLTDELRIHRLIVILSISILLCIETIISGTIYIAYRDVAVVAFPLFLISFLATGVYFDIFFTSLSNWFDQGEDYE